MLSYDIFASPSTGPGSAQRYNPTTGIWTPTGAVPVALTGPDQGYELGPSLLLPDGRVFLLGANNRSVLYHPTSNTWTTGPSLPARFGCDDAPAAMLPNGQVLFVADHYGTASTFVSAPSKMFLFNPIANTITDVTPGGQLGTILASSIAQQFIMLVLPNGHVLMATGAGTLWDYSPSGSADPSWAPTITTVAKTSGTTYSLSGTQLNGLSEGSSFGDDLETSTNYPIVRLKNSAGVIKYCRTTNWAPGLVASGSRLTTTNFTLPTGTPDGQYQVSVIANGIASQSHSLTIGAIPIPNVLAVYNAGTKTLTLTGDANPNSVTVSLQAGLLKVEGANTTTINHSSSFSVAHSGKLILNSTLGDGDDSIAVIGIDSSTTTIDLGPGADKSAFTLCNIATLNVDGGLGTDIVTVTSSTIRNYNRTNVP